SPKSKTEDPQNAKAVTTTNKPANKKAEWVYEGSNVNRVTAPAASPSSPGTAPLPRVPAPPPLPVNYAALLSSYRAIVVGGHIDWSPQWTQRLRDYVKSGGTVVLNPAQIKNFPSELLGLRLTGVTAEAHNARCLATGEALQNLSGQIFRYEKVELMGAVVLVASGGGDPLVTVNKLGNGTVVFSALPDLLGEDERIVPFAAHMLAHVFADAAPIKVNGDVEYLINRNTNGWIVTLINNNGVYKSQQGMAQVDRSAVVTATISLRSQEINTAFDWITEKTIDVKSENGGSVASVSIPAGGISIVEFRPPSPRTR
ncbi:MAG: hypothetical protein ABJB21_00420, partial [bacterium]